MTGRRSAALLGAGGFVAATAPALTAIGPLRRSLLPRLSGSSTTRHIALTFDDGPDPVSTPAFLDLLAAQDRRATFFVLGKHAFSNAALLQRMVGAGHEVAVHGWSHRCTAIIPPTRLAGELRAAREAIEDVTGTQVTWYRPPYGVFTTETFLACRSLELEPMLWTAWGRDWERRATPRRISRSVLRTLRPGGTILLHDTDRHSAEGSWRQTLAAVSALLAGPLADAEVGPLRDHWRPGHVPESASGARVLAAVSPRKSA